MQLPLRPFCRGAREGSPVPLSLTARSPSVRIGLLALAYFASARLGDVFAFSPDGISSLRPAFGVALSALLLLEESLWPGIFLGALAARLDHGSPAGVALVHAVGQTLSVVVAAVALRQLDGWRARLDRVQEVFSLIAVSMMAPVVSATVGVLALRVAGALPSARLEPAWVSWWAGELLGALLVVPFALVWLRERPPMPAPRRALEATVLVIALAAVTGLTSLDGGASSSLIYPLVIWAALRFELRGATAAGLLVAVVTLAARGPLVSVTPGATAYDLQITLGVTMILALVIGATTTERQRALHAWREATESLRALFDAAPAAIIAIDFEDRVTRWNRGAERIFGYAADEVIGRRVPFVPPGLQSEYLSLKRRQLEGESIVGFESIRLHRDGHPIDVSMSLAVLYDAAGRVSGTLGIIEDITDRRREQGQLRDSEIRLHAALESLQTIFDHIPVMLCVVDADGRVQRVNRAWQERLGWTQDEMSEPGDDDRATVSACVRSADARWTDLELRTRSGQRLDTAWAGVRLSDGTTIAIGQDVSERKRAEHALHVTEAQLRQAHKMEAVGRLAGGVAHDFNNLLTSIIGHTDLMLGGLDAGHPLREDIGEVRHAAERAADLTSQLLAFSRKQVIEPRVLDLNATIERITGMLRRLIGEHIELVTELESTLGRVVADPGQIEQVIVNLAVNARDAMPEGGRLRIATANAVLDGDFIREHVGAVAGPHVVLAVTDDGIGMDPEIQANIFEPFFTTKDKTKGTGLGLATVYGIVKQSGGYVEVESLPGRGTTMRVYLPLAMVLPHHSEAPSEERDTEGSETILLVEDEDSVRGLTQRILTRAGYHVLSARDANEALQISAQHAEPIDLLLTDVIMSGLSGPRLAETLLAIRPNVTVMFMSGYNEDTMLRQGVMTHGVAYLQKPFTPASLLRRVRLVLEQRLAGLEKDTRVAG